MQVSQSPLVLLLPLFDWLSLLKIAKGVGQTLITPLLLFFSGYTLVIVTRLVCKIALRNLLGSFIRLMDLECFWTAENKIWPQYKILQCFLQTSTSIFWEGKNWIWSRCRKRKFATKLVDKDQITTLKKNITNLTFWMWEWILIMTVTAMIATASISDNEITLCWKLLWKQTTSKI